MRLYLSTILCLLAFSPINTLALEPVNEAHAMFYYQVPFSANKPEEKKHSFGFRMDHASFEQGDMIQYNQLMNQTAAFDFKLGRTGVEGMYVAGVDYLKQYRLNKAAEDEGDTSMSEPEDTSNPVKDVATDVGNTISDIAETVPLGFIMGGVIAIVLVAGVGG